MKMKQKCTSARVREGTWCWRWEEATARSERGIDQSTKPDEEASEELQNINNFQISYTCNCLPLLIIGHPRFSLFKYFE